jgi:ferredoxin
MNDDLCIRCGICHKACPCDAVRHDSERIPLDVQANMDWVKDLLRHYASPDEKEAFLGRMRNNFNREKVIAEKTLEAIDQLKS